MAQKFSDKKIVQYDEILNYEDDLKYSFSDSKVNLKELIDFLGKTISSNDKHLC